MPPRRRSLGCALLLLAVAPGAAAQGTSLRLTSDGNANPGLIQRVRLPIGLDGQAADLSPPVDLGDPLNSAGGSFTIELWLRGVAQQNQSGGTCGLGGVDWINCAIVLDRDINGPPEVGDFGLSVCDAGSVSAGVEQEGGGRQGVCAEQTNVLDGAWHHVAWTRDAAGMLCLFVDGVQGDCRSGPAGSLSYDDTRMPSSPSGQDPTLVFGAEKHGFAYPGFRGWLDDVRLSGTVRYASCGNGNTCFVPPSAPFTTDASTLGLFGFEEAAAGAACSCAGPLVPVSAAGTCVQDASAGASHAECRHGRTGTRFGPSYSAFSPFLAGDADADAIPDRSDNCPFRANPGQQDTWGPGGVRDGVGDACECGNNDSDGDAGDTADIVALRNELAGLAPGVADASRCSVIGGPDDCDVRDLAVLLRAALSPPRGPGIADLCDAAVP